ncbi:hypothetical protein [Comamonas flocculans]|uniref:hypothetical protein n=1 Tax=Comamonas flocculans TaxID=2597701 RepID=UPI00164590A1|nr:hypothetical protein [Comamonas flocculans]
MNGHGGRRLIALLGDRRLAWPGLLLAAVLALPAARTLLEASMWRHMVLQYPLWMLSGALLAGGLSGRMRERLARWNASGISGLLLAGTVITVLMIPRVLDLALVAPAVELAKCGALLAAGAALRLSWRQAGLVAQGFFLGNMLLMGAVVGQLYAQSPLRLCNAYLLGDQERLGQWLTAISTTVALLWLAQVFWWVARRDADTGRMAGTQAPQDAAAREGASAPSPQSP